MALIFPASPTLNQTYTSGSTVWTWQGTTWAKTSTAYIADGSITTVKIADLAVTSPKLATAVTNSIAAGGGGIKITSIVVTDSSYTNLDDTALDTAGGYIKIIGTGFASGCQVLVNQVPATSTTFVSSTEIRAQLPSTIAGTYVVYVANTDGSVGIRINGITFSATPTWTTSSSLPSSAVSSAISIQLVATLATTYTLTSGSTLPTGLTLSSGGLLSGSVTGIESETTYSFNITATDAELQDSPRTFSITISVKDPYFNSTTLLLSGNGTNNAQNNTFVDSSTNNFAITRTGTPTQGTFSPFSQTGWSNYFGSGNYLSTSSNAAFGLGTGDFTLEAWVFPTSAYTTYNYIFLVNQYGLTLYITGGNLVVRKGYVADVLSSTTIPALNVWTHIAVTRNGTTLRIFVNGIQTATTTDSFDWPQGNLIIGNDGTNVAPWNGYISNLRLVKGTALYTANFTPSIAPLTAISGTSILTCQSNRFKDNSSNAFAVTITGVPSIEAFSPFAPGAGYSTSTVGGSIRFNGTTDYLTISNSNLALNTGDFTVECWINADTGLTDKGIFEGRTGGTGTTGFTLTAISPTSIRIYSGSALITSGTISYVKTWCHVAVVRLSGTTTLYINGVSQGTTASLGNLTDSSFVIGAGKYAIAPSVDAFFTGYISNFRMVKGTALYTANFTPSTTPLTAVANTSLLLNGTNAGIIDSTAKNLITTVGDAKISTTQSKFGEIGRAHV